MKKGFVFIETIIVITVLTVGLMSIYANYSKILANTKEFNTFDTTEYNYKTYYLKKLFLSGEMKTTTGVNITNVLSNYNKCYLVQTPFSDGTITISGTSILYAKVCILKDVTETDDSVETYINDKQTELDAYIIDYLLNQDLHEKNDTLFLVEYKKKDIMNFSASDEEYLTYISSLNF